MKTIQEEYKERLEHFRKDINDLITAGFKETQKVPPLAFAMIRKNGKWAIVIMAGLEGLFANDIEKDLAAELIKKMQKDIKPLAIAFVSEAWISMTKDKNLDDVLDQNGNYRDEKFKPVNDPNRKEVVMISFETFDKQIIDTWEIVRDGKNAKLTTLNISDNKWQKKDPDHKHGRFSNLLTENYSEFAQSYREQENLN